jgi:predicted glycosyl hydrolase (DUF1957 family)
MKKLSIVLVLMSMLSVNAIAADAAATKKEDAKKEEGPSAEMREKMALHHEAMAKCLRSTKTMKECHQEMMGQCKEAMGGEKCEMMGHMGHMGKKCKGMGMGHEMMNDHHDDLEKSEKSGK